MITKIISGFQTGADIGAIKAAKDNAVETGGWIPKGYKTLDGSRPTYADLYNAKQHSSANYASRTWDNILDSDGTLRIAGNFNSAGEKCTLNGIKAHCKPYCDLNVADWIGLSREDKVSLVGKIIFSWILKNKIQILNVAGNSEKTYPGIEAITYEVVEILLKTDRWYNELG